MTKPVDIPEWMGENRKIIFACSFSHFKVTTRRFENTFWAPVIFPLDKGVLYQVSINLSQLEIVLCFRRQHVWRQL